MMAVQTQFNDNGYKNWLRACLGLQYLKEGILDFVDSEVKQFHASVINNVCKYVRCNQCTTEQLTNRRHPQRCPNNICDRIRQEIENKHRFGPCWKNTDATKWCTDYWEIGKCFMSPGYTAVSKATDTDCTGLLSVCINGLFLPPSISGQITHPSVIPGAAPDIFHENRDVRNALLHSASMSISDAERQGYIDDMVKLLTNYKTPIDQVTQAAIDKLNELNSTNMVILPAAELSILQNKLNDVSISLTQFEEQQKTDSKEHKELIHINSDSLLVLKQRIDELPINSKEEMTKILDTFKSLQERNEHLNTQHSHLKNRIVDHETQIEGRLDDHESQINDRLGGHETHIAHRLEDHKTQIIDRLGGHETHIAHRFEDHESHIKDRLGGHETHIAHRFEDHESHIKDRLGGHETQIEHRLGDYEVEIKKRLGGYEAHIEKRLDGHEVQTEKRLGNHEAQTVKRLDDHEAQTEKQLDDHEVQTEKRLDDHEAQTEKRLDDHEAQTEKRLGDHEAQTEKRLGDHEAQTEKRLDGHEVQTEKRLGDHESQTEKRLGDHEAQSEKRLDGHEVQTEKRLGDHESQTEKRLGDHEAQSEKRLDGHEVQTEKRLGDHEAQTEKRLGDHEAQTEKRLGDHEAQTEKRLDGHEVQTEKRLGDHESHTEKRIGDHEAQTEKRLWDHEAQTEKRLDGHEVQTEKRLGDHESQTEKRLGDHEAQTEKRLADQEAHIEDRFRGDEAHIEERLDGHEAQTEHPLSVQASQRTRFHKIGTYVIAKLTGQNRHIKDIQDFLVAKYKRDELSVPMSPLLRTYNVNVYEVYTELIIRDDLVHNPKCTVKNNSDRGYKYYEQCWNQETSKSYQEVLYDGKTRCKNIYVIGKAGMGKTTWSRKLVATWIEAKAIKGREQKPDENVRILQDYDLVFYISLRHARADHHIMQMIEHQLFRDNKDLLTAVKKVLDKPKYSSRCIIILDGLDEWCSPDDDMSTDGLPVADPSWKCSIITTTRSWKLEDLQLQPNKIDRAVEIQGLDKDGIDKLTDHVVATLNKNSDKIKIASDFESQVTPSIKACMQVPSLLTIFVCLWHDDVSINEHLAGTYTKLIEMLIRCAEGDKRKRLFQKIPKEMLDEMKRNWSSEKSSYPNSLSGAKLFVSYLPFLLRLGKLAFDTLISGSKESTLVFDYESVEEFICEAELELSLKLGILSQTTERGSVCKEKFSLSYLHKTMQEYLMALYMVCGDNKADSLNRYKAYCVNETTVLEMENVLLFTSGLCPETAGEISYHIAEMEPSAPIHQVLLRCWRESRAASSTSDHIYIKHHFLQGFPVTYDEDTMCYLRQATHKNSFMHIENLSKLFRTSVVDLSACHALKELDCKGSDVPIRVPPSLEKVIIESCTRSKGSVLDLSGCKRLRHLECRRSDIPIRIPHSLETVVLEDYRQSNEFMQDLSECQSLRKLHCTRCYVPVVPRNIEELVIEECKGLDGSVLDLSGCERLRKLTCSECSLPVVPRSLEELIIEVYTGSKQSVLDLSGCQSLRKLHYMSSSARLRVPSSLEEVEIDGHWVYPENVLDLSGCQSLRTLTYTRSPVPLRIPARELDVLRTDIWTADLILQSLVCT